MSTLRSVIDQMAAVPDDELSIEDLDAKITEISHARDQLDVLLDHPRHSLSEWTNGPDTPSPSTSDAFSWKGCPTGHFALSASGIATWTTHECGFVVSRPRRVVSSS